VLHWYDSTNKKVDQLHEARQEDALKKESEREDTLRRAAGPSGSSFRRGSLYAAESLGTADTDYEVYPAHNGNWTFLGGGQFGRKAFSPEERAAFQSIRFRGRFSSETKNILKLLFTKP
jgi:hypothetical protein